MTKIIRANELTLHDTFIKQNCEYWVSKITETGIYVKSYSVHKFSNHTIIGAKSQERVELTGKHIPGKRPRKIRVSVWSTQEEIGTFNSMKDAFTTLNLPQNHIYEYLKGRSKRPTQYGFHFEKI